MTEPDTTTQENETDDNSEQILITETKNTQVQVKTTETYFTLNLHFLIEVQLIISLFAMCRNV